MIGRVAVVRLTLPEDEKCVDKGNNAKHEARAAGCFFCRTRTRHEMDGGGLARIRLPQAGYPNSLESQSATTQWPPPRAAL
jgi:hypothetical protein